MPGFRRGSTHPQVIGAEVKGRLLTLDETAALSSGRQAFAVWATKLYLPVYWARYRAVNCGRYRFSKHVYVCDVPRGTFFQVIRHHDKLTDFNAALVGNSGCKKLFLETSCRWVSPEGATFTRVTTPLSKECRYDPAPGSIAAWRYGCSLDVPDTFVCAKSSVAAHVLTAPSHVTQQSEIRPARWPLSRKAGASAAHGRDPIAVGSRQEQEPEHCRAAAVI